MTTVDPQPAWRDRFREAWHGFRRWRRARPFWGGLLTALAQPVPAVPAGTRPASAVPAVGSIRCAAGPRDLRPYVVLPVLLGLAAAVALAAPGPTLVHAVAPPTAPCPTPAPDQGGTRPTPTGTPGATPAPAETPAPPAPSLSPGTGGGREAVRDILDGIGDLLDGGRDADEEAAPGATPSTTPSVRPTAIPGVHPTTNRSVRPTVTPSVRPTATGRPAAPGRGAPRPARSRADPGRWCRAGHCPGSPPTRGSRWWRRSRRSSAVRR
ncbi:hypothetical protein DER29_6838 [Micromonospora sp. M71_S20]|nr:hypothetical protein DER29_6838 [Micromonospora sp. M71_S20]